MRFILFILDLKILSVTERHSLLKCFERVTQEHSLREQIWVALVHILKKLYEVAVTELCPLLLLFVFTKS